jgi:hypothetical protein
MSYQHRNVTVILLALMAAPLVEATSAHTWVGGNGNDSNAGTQTSPYATFQTAVNNTSAGGLVSVASPGDFGAVTISHSITIDGGGIGGSITFTGAEGIYVYASTSDTITLRHLTVNGLGVGQYAIYLSQGLNYVIEDCHLENFTTIGIGLQSSSTANVVVRNTTITGGQIGVRTYQSSGQVNYDSLSLRNVSISGASGAGVFSRNGIMEISDSIITQSYVGVEADTSAYINVANSVISLNGTDEEAFTGGTIYVSNNNTLYANNGTGGASGGGLMSVVDSRAMRAGSVAPPPPDKPRQHRQ